MNSHEMKQCPYCAEDIRAEAIKCRYCGSNLTRKKVNLDFLQTPGHWMRVNEGKKIAGVCTGIAEELDSPVLILPLRLFFIITTLFYLFGLWVYIILWLLMPAPTDGTGRGRSSVYGPGSGGRPAPPPPPRRKAPPADDDDFEVVDSEPADESPEDDHSRYAPGFTGIDGEQPAPAAEEAAAPEPAADDGPPPDDAPEVKTEPKERRMIYPALGTGLVVFGVIVMLRVYLRAMEEFVGVSMPPTVLFFGYLSALGMTAAMTVRYFRMQRVHSFVRVPS